MIIRMGDIYRKGRHQKFVWGRRGKRIELRNYGSEPFTSAIVTSDELMRDWHLVQMNYSGRVLDEVPA